MEIYVDDTVEELTSASERIKEKAGEVEETAWDEPESILSSDSNEPKGVNERSIFDDVDA